MYRVARAWQSLGHGPLRPVDYLGIAGGVAAAIALAVVIVLVPGGTGAPARAVPPMKTDLTVAAVPAGDSAGLFVALHDGLFKAQGLHVTFVPAISSETVIAAQAAGQVRHQSAATTSAIYRRRSVTTSA